MKIILPVNIADRYVSAVERETERARLYTVLIATESAAALAQRLADESAYRARVAREKLEDFEGEAQS